MFALLLVYSSQLFMFLFLYALNVVAAKVSSALISMQLFPPLREIITVCSAAHFAWIMV